MDVGANDLFSVAGKIDDKLPTRAVEDGRGRRRIPSLCRQKVGQH